MGLISSITQLFIDLSECMTFFADVFALLPTVVQLVIYFAFGGMILLGLMTMVLRGV